MLGMWRNQNVLRTHRLLYGNPIPHMPGVSKRNRKQGRMNDHERHMRRAIELAANVHELPFGAVIVSRDTGSILLEPWRDTVN